jgi:hypothetical protein
LATYARPAENQLSGRSTRHRFRRSPRSSSSVTGFTGPPRRFAQMSFVTADAWRAFLSIDALQCLAVTLAFFQLLTAVTWTRRHFMSLTLTTCMAAVIATPTVWRTDWQASLPSALAAYLTPHSGSLFPVFPWSGYTLLGAAAGIVRRILRLPGRLECPGAAVPVRVRRAFSASCTGLPGIGGLSPGMVKRSQ